MNEHEFVTYCEETTAEVMTDLTVIPFNTSVQRIWLILSSLQYTWRDPSLSKPMRDTLRSIGDNITKRILELHPSAELLINAGWDVSQDIPQAGSVLVDDDDDERNDLWWMPFS